MKSEFVDTKQMTANSKNPYVTKTGMVIDPSHAFFNLPGIDKVFPTIKVQSYQSLQMALKQEVVSSQTHLMVFEIGDQTLSIPLRDVAFHHVAQGELNKQPWAVFFCSACNMGTAINPVINGKTHHFSATGIYNSMAIFRDAETGSFWEHATGECIQGPLQGNCLEIIPAQFLLVEQVLENNPSALFTTSKKTWWTRLLDFLLLRSMLTPEGDMPPPFRLSMGKQDTRLPELQLGLGVWFNDKARFYSMQSLKAHNNALIDTFNREKLVVIIDPIAQVPMAYCCNASSCRWDGDTLLLNTGECIRNGYVQTLPSVKRRIDTSHQQFVRWYAFSYMFPNCEIFDFQK
ncbi:MAG: DUF3179 domain-containing (seleno)protein [Candidatus Promineifilaceae bacterium]